MQFELVDVGERASWGARPPRRPWRPFSKPPRLVVFHHTVSGIGRVLGPEEEAFLQREMQRHHMNLGWGDIGQHFTVFKSGRILEGRPLGAVGVHAAGANSYTIGIEHQGNFEVEEPTEAQLEASARLIASLYRHFSWPDDGGERLRPHREFSRTACPGRYGMVSLDHVRSIVSRLVSVSGGTDKSMRYPFQLEHGGVTSSSGTVVRSGFTSTPWTVRVASTSRCIGGAPSLSSRPMLLGGRGWMCLGGFRWRCLGWCPAAST